MRAGCFAVMLALVLAAPRPVATITAASLSVRDVQAAINKARGGDTVLIPNGSAVWSSGVSISRKAIHLKGSGATNITYGREPSVGGPLIEITETPSGYVEVSHLHFVPGTFNDYTIVVSGGGKPVLIHDNAWGTGMLSGIRFETLHGVVWSNTMDTGDPDYLHTGSTQFVSQKIEQVADSVWLAPSTMGDKDPDGEHNLYVEDNRIRLVCCGAMDPDDNARMVIRHNTFDNSGTASHGADTSPIGARHVELYDNTFLFTDHGDCDGSKTAGLPYLVHMRGGTWVITGNTVPKISSCAYGDKVSFLSTVMNLQRNGGQFACWGDGGHRRHQDLPRGVTDNQYPAPHQVGTGADGTKQIGDPAYIWDNTGPGASSYSNEDYGAGECQDPLASVATYLVTGRDVMRDTPKPGWKRYPYPHPLRARAGTTAQ